MYMSYRWRESFNTVRSPSDSWHHHNGDWHVWAQNAGRRGGGMDHTSVAALTNQLCSDRGVVRVFEYSINVLYYKYGRNQSWTLLGNKRTRNILKDIDWNEKWKCNSKCPQLQKPNQKNYKYSFCLMVQASDHVYVLPKTYTYHTDLPAKI